MSQNIKALDELVEEYTNKETELAKVEQELVSKDQQFANFIATQKRLKEAKEVLTGFIKEAMEAEGITEHETDTVRLKLTPSGKYRASNIETVSDEICDIKKTINNKKVKAFLELNGKLPEGVESAGNILRITIKGERAS